jgi:chitinase
MFRSMLGNHSQQAKLFILLLLMPLFFTHCVAADPGSDEEMVQPNPDIWVSAYLATWQHNAGTQYSNWGAIRTQDIDWDAFTHLFYFALNIGADGRPSHSFDPTLRRNFNEDRLRTIVPAAHQHNKHILFSVGGAGNYSGFSSAITPEHRMTFIATIKNLIDTYGFDGVDLDMEPIRRNDYNNFREFVRLLHDTFSQMTTNRGERPLITIAALKGYELSLLYADVQDYVDQINIMTYDMAQAWSGWQAWHNSALYSDGVRFDRNGRQMPSIEEKLEVALQAGLKREKLGIGIDFYGYIWQGLHLLEKWDGWPAQDLSIMERPGGVPYSELRERFALSKAAWDPVAETSYLNNVYPKAFVSFDNELSIKKKVAYAKQQGLGGVILWELGGGYLDSSSTGVRDPLLQAVKEELYRNYTDYESVTQ